MALGERLLRADPAAYHHVADRLAAFVTSVEQLEASLAEPLEFDLPAPAK